MYTHIAKLLSQIHLYLSISTTKNDIILMRIDSLSILAHLLQIQTTYATTCHPMKPSVARMSSMTSSSADTEWKTLNNTIAVHILSEKI